MIEGRKTESHRKPPTKNSSQLKLPLFQFDMPPETMLNDYGGEEILFARENPC